MLIKFTPNKLILILMIVFPITTIYQGLPMLENVNRLIVFFLMGFMILSFFVDSIRTIDIFYLIVGAILSFICIVYTGKPYYINCFVFFPFWIIFLIYSAKNYDNMMDEAVKDIALLKGVIYVWEITVFISFFFSRCYVEEWGDRYFQSFSNAPHRFASTCVVIMAYVFILFLITQKYTSLLHMVLPFIGLFVGGARTYLAMGIVFILTMYYIVCPKKVVFWSSIVPLLLLLWVIIMFTPIGTKMSSTLSGEGYYGYWATLTNGRSIFWVEDLEGFFNLSTIRKLVGNGANFVYDLNENGTAGRKLWAHNDFINILCTNGYLGLVLYFVTFFGFVKRQMKQVGSSKFIPMAAFYFICMFNAFFNMLYSYTSAVVGIPFVLYALYTLPILMERKNSEEVIE